VVFDKKTFDEGLKTGGVLMTTIGGVEHYKISSYSDLDSILGSKWRYRELNSTGDFCYVILDKVTT